jgi:hypothetical protein
MARRGLGKAFDRLKKSGQVALDKLKFAPLIPYVPAMNAFIKMKDKNWKFTTKVEKTATRFYELYVKRNSFDYDSNAADNFEDKVTDYMNDENESYYSGYDNVIPPELISVVVQTVIQMVSGVAKKVKEGKATKQEEAIVAATDQAEEEFKATAKQAEIIGKSEGTEAKGGLGSMGLADYLPYILGVIVLALIGYALLKKK